MKKVLIKALKNWYYFVIIGLLSLELLVFLGLGENSYIPTHDNLDLFIPHLKMLQSSGTFFSHGDTLPILGGITRDVFGSEFSLYNLLYMIFPTYYAYIIGYFLAIFISMLSCFLLARDILKEQFSTYRPLVLLFGLTLGLLPVFPAYAISFASIPLVIYLIRRFSAKPSWIFGILLFCYPIISYFSYFGFFILGYLVCYTIFICIRKRKLQKGLLLSIPILSLGYVFFEYRLFYAMLFDDTVTIRNTMVIASYSFPQIWATIKEGFLQSTFHAGDSHQYFVLPVVILYFVILNCKYLWTKQWNRILKDPFNLVFLFICFNSTIYGLYYLEPFRNLFIALIPPLEGFQFYRTLFFNPFLWYLLLFILVKRMYDKKKTLWILTANIIAFSALFIVVTKPAVYNAFYDTAYNTVLKYVKNIAPETLNYKEFYSSDLFEQIKEEIDYNGEYSMAYGFHPGILTYNNIATLDGYLGLYAQDYKDSFRKIIAPALDRSPYFESYFDNWGARAYLFPGFDGGSYLPYRNLTLSDSNLYMDTDAFLALEGSYIFSRFALSNASDLSLSFLGSFTDKSSPYTIYVYSATN